MPRACTVCTSPQCQSVEAEIIAGRPVRVIATLYGLGHLAVHRHARNHLPASIYAAAVTLVSQLDGGSGDPSESSLAIAGSPEPAERLCDIDRYPNAPGRTGRMLMLDDEPVAAEAITTSFNANPIAPGAPSPLGLLALVHDLRDRALAILAQAETAGDPKTALAAIREARGLLETLARLEPPGASAGTTTLSSSPEWTRVRSALLSALAPFPEARLAAATALVSTGALS